MRSSPAYPCFTSLAAPLRGRARALMEAVFAAGTAVGLAAVAAGCESPGCRSTRIDEVRTHGETALTDVLELQLRAAGSQMAVGLGIVPHPAVPIAGEMTAVSPAPPPSVPSR